MYYLTCRNRSYTLNFIAPDGLFFASDICNFALLDSIMRNETFDVPASHSMVASEPTSAELLWLEEPTSSSAQDPTNMPRCQRVMTSLNHEMATSQPDQCYQFNITREGKHPGWPAEHIATLSVAKNAIDNGELGNISQALSLVNLEGLCSRLKAKKYF